MNWSIENIYMYIYILYFWESIHVLRRGVTTFWEMFGFGKELFYWPTQFWFCAPPGSGITKVWWLRGIWRCSDRLDKIRTHLRVYQLINCIIKASVLCKWLRHSHVTASMPSFGTGCVKWIYKSIKISHILNWIHPPKCVYQNVCTKMLVPKCIILN